MSAAPLLLHRDDETHGVDQYARAVATAVAKLDVEVTYRSAHGLDSSQLAHVHFTDRLWGSSPERAAERFERLAARGPVSVTLHDVPQSSDGSRGFPRRTECYRRVVQAAAGTVCNSAHEQRLLEVALGRHVAVHVVPLPAQPPQPRAADWRPSDEVAVLGFYYPGKGHLEVVEAVAALPVESRPRVVALGCASSGHEQELLDLGRHAAQLGVDFTSTGFLSTAERLARSRAVAVPIIAHQHVSASGSLTDWLSAGRRPLTVDSDYFREMDAIRPETMHLVRPGHLAEELQAALMHPESTWLDEATSTSPSLEEIARAYLSWWAEL
ncbi:hypothetical protein C5B85_08535 [Pseudoclavibacter sp. AY1F1]|uniref:hypothetical protein n=1 Tax=Pseudoclavibacter sp. AY1F1 TaxID=2080583 RepID=UPI000CE76E8C|nr:hypothetical protein [Pseudoclavibacter sp. AY1F1]PPF44785.1 hypothetical protein C5B85_08535 [Pseudoclavibacter sp. AY1F1]